MGSNGIVNLYYFNIVNCLHNKVGGILQGNMAGCTLRYCKLMDLPEVQECVISPCGSSVLEHHCPMEWNRTQSRCSNRED